ncbi:unnamed protein product [Cutaneotrichosporon oleaginosum]
MGDHAPSPPRRPQRSTLRLSIHTLALDDPLSAPASTASLPKRTSSMPPPDLLGESMMRSKSETDILSPPPASPQRPATAHLRASRGRRKPVPSMLDADFGHALSIDTSCGSASAPLSAPPGASTKRPARRNAELMAFLDDGPLPPPPPRPRGPSVSSMSALSTLSAASQTRPYTLPVDPPRRGGTPPPSPPVTPTPPSSYHRHNGSAHSHPSTHSHAPFFGGLPRYSTVELVSDASRSASRSQPSLAVGEPDTRERLPRYEATHEPITLAATLWRWGFFFPPFWVIGMFILWSPLKYDGADEEKKQTVVEMLSIVRETELKYARRCAIACAVLAGIAVILVIVLCAVLVPK